MSAGTALLVALSGGVGALVRALVGRRVTRRSGGPSAAGTFAVNISGAFLLGLLIGLGPSDDATLVLGVGLLGGYTTFSTWMFETQQLAAEGAVRFAALNVAASSVVGLGAIWMGRLLGGS